MWTDVHKYFRIYNFENDYYKMFLLFKVELFFSLMIIVLLCLIWKFRFMIIVYLIG